VIYLSIKEVRLQKRIKAKTMCELIGVKRITYYKKETGHVKFSLDEAKKIADFLEMPIEEIFFADEVSKIETF
jgi:DNA-binding XRE family transcriptional regulator